MASEGFLFFSIAIISAVIAALTGLVSEIAGMYIAAAVLSFIALFVIFFFRDPEREITARPEDIVSPGDGKVVAVVNEIENDYFKGNVNRISIFLSIFDVHINRVPVSGKVDYLKYKKGKFKAAFKKDASIVNEQSIIGISNPLGKVLFKQIAGLIARRIIYRLEEGYEVNIGDRYGLIKFGSRVDVLFPENVEILVNKGDRVTGGKTIIGRFKK